MILDEISFSNRLNESDVGLLFAGTNVRILPLFLISFISIRLIIILTSL